MIVNDYTPLNTFESDIETNNKSNQIELVDVDNNNNNKKNEDICSICLENNDNSSLELKCKCGNKFHKKCIDDLNRFNIKKCPLCNKKLYNRISEEVVLTDNPCLRFLFVILVSIYFLIYFTNVFVFPLRFLFYPSELKYCDNIYKKCEYYLTDGILVNNTINEKFFDFDVKYELVSSYQYKLGSVKKTCVNLESHDFVSLSNALEVSTRSIGLEKQIFISYDNDREDCKTNYKWYNPLKFKVNALSIINGISFVLSFIVSVIRYEIMYESIYYHFSNLVKIPAIIIGYLIYTIVISINLLSSLLFVYYYNK